MGLIEQLGGYDAVMNKLNSEYQPIDEFIQLEKAILEYRREHSIFVVGDRVVLLNWDNNSKIYSIKDVYEHKVYDGNQHSYSTFIYLLDDWCYERWFNNREIRHATNEENKLGRRL